MNERGPWYLMDFEPLDPDKPLIFWRCTICGALSDEDGMLRHNTWHEESS